MNYEALPQLIAFGIAAGAVAFAKPIKNELRRRRYTRGRQLGAKKQQSPRADDLLWGNCRIPRPSARRHFLVIGTTGSGKSLLQRRLMAPVLKGIEPGKDQRALIFDAKNDIVPFLKHIGTTCPVYSLNPLETRTDIPQAVRWKISADICSPARAMNLVANLIPSEKGGSNQYFTDAARQVVTGVCESFIRHTADKWEFSDLVYASLSQDRIREVLSRDEMGREVLAAFFGDDRTAYQVFTTVYSRMAYYRPVAAMWQRTKSSLSLRDWLTTDSILIIGSNATVKTALDAINEQIMRVIVEEMDIQPNSDTRETWIWIDEARLSGPLLKGSILPYAAVKARSKGSCIVLGFQDIEGLREVAGVRIANELVAQCSHKALLRMESDESAKYASNLIGSFETIEHFASDVAGLRSRNNVNEHRVNKSAVLPSEFYNIPLTTQSNGLTGYFLSPENGAMRSTIAGNDLIDVVVTGESKTVASIEATTQTLKPWSSMARSVLRLKASLNLRTGRSKPTKLYGHVWSKMSPETYSQSLTRKD